MISVRGLVKHFGGVVAVDNVDINIERGSITGLIGPNGAGKTTLFNMIAGNIVPNSGKITLDGENVTGLKPHELFTKGLLRTFQISHEFKTLSVLDNLMMVPPFQKGESLLGALFLRKEVDLQEAENRKRAEDILSFLNMRHISSELAGNLSGGQKKLLELGRTMMVDAKIVFLDEVGAGVNRSLLKEIGNAIINMNREREYTFCMIEHDIDFISRLCNPVIVMAEGKIMVEGSSDDIKSNEAVIEAYLGKGIKNKKP